LVQARQEAISATSIHDPDAHSRLENFSENKQDQDQQPANGISVSSAHVPQAESVEVTALNLELSTLSTSYASLQNTLVLLQTQLVDVKRVNQELQEENESYMILLREKTLSGQYDVMGQVGVNSDSDDDEADYIGNNDRGSLRSSARSVLEVVDETEEEHYSLSKDSDLDPEFRQDTDDEQASFIGDLSPNLGVPSGTGESLAGLPLTGPGLDLAAELGRAENKDVTSRNNSPTPVDLGSPRRNRNRKGVVSPNGGRKVSSLASEFAVSSSKSDLDTLRKEVKSLKDANKALSLYASKIIDRIIAQDGFEHVLSVDYEKSPTTPSAATTSFANFFSSPKKPSDKKARPQSFFGFASSTNNPPLLSPSIGAEKLTTFDSIRPTAATPSTAVPFPERGPLTPAPALDSAAAAASKRGDKRRSFSLDWSSFSIFGGEKKPADARTPPTNPNLRPLTLGTFAAAAQPARKLDTTEDEEDRRERERLQATMKLMGIESQPTPPVPVSARTSISGDPASRVSVEDRPPLTPSDSIDSVPKTTPARWSLFRSRSTRTDSGSSSPALSGAVSSNPADLTQEALEHAEAQQKLATLDAHEKLLAEQLSKGGGGGFTEIQPRSSRRSRKSAGGSNSGSTVWSAGMSKDEHSDE
jgi:hypothetical protein